MTSEFVTTANNRRLAFARYGKPGGKPLFYFHGWPSSKAQAALSHKTAVDLGIEIVAPDRPGICESSFDPARRIIDWPGTVAELAEHLGWSEYGVLGVSGGGPYAVACAVNPPQGLTKVGITCGAPHSSWLSTSSHVRPMMRRAAMLPDGPAVGALKLARMTVLALGGRNILRLGRPFMQRFDRAILEEPAVLSFVADSAAAAFVSPARGIWYDFMLLKSEWGVSLEKSMVPTHLWYGDMDNVCPASDLPTSILKNPLVRLELVPGEGHYSLPVRHARSILGFFAGT